MKKRLTLSSYYPTHVQSKAVFSTQLWGMFREDLLAEEGNARIDPWEAQAQLFCACVERARHQKRPGGGTPGESHSCQVNCIILCRVRLPLPSALCGYSYSCFRRSIFSRYANARILSDHGFKSVGGFLMLDLTQSKLASRYSKYLPMKGYSSAW